MKKIITVDGNEACANTAYMFTELAGIYPITPSSTMAELVDDWGNKGRLNLFNDTVKVVEMQSEAGAAGLVHGSLQAGCLTTTFTASQGLLLMIPNIYKMAGEMLPGVLHVAARSISTHALSIFGDHQDIYATRPTGACILASSSVQDASYMAAVAHLSAIKGSLPFLHFFDGFRTSHEINKIEVLEKEDYETMIDYEALTRFRSKALNPLNPVTRGTAQNGDIYFQNTEVRNKYYDAIPNIVNDYMKMINDKAGTNYKPFNYYGDKDAELVIIAMGSVCETIKETIDYLNGKIGLIEVHLYRPFATNYLLEVLPKTVKSIAVLDRTKEPGSIGEPLYLDVVSALKDYDITIVGGRYGLSSKDTDPAQIKAVYDMLKDKPVHNFTIGIIDDVTNLSLDTDKTFKISDSLEFLIYGYGSDGMVSASKSIMKIVGTNTNKYVQGYFEYDSKKSGGVTVSHLRFNDNKIKSTYFVNNPKLVVCTKEGYIDKYDMLSNIKENGVFLLNTDNSVKELENINDNIKKILIERNIKFYKIDAFSLAASLGLGNKISTIIQSVIVKLSNILDYEEAKKAMKEEAKKSYFDKGEKVLEANYRAIDEAVNYLELVNLKDEKVIEKVDRKSDLYNEINTRKGDHLPTSAFLDIADGSFEAMTSARDKRAISDNVPKWLNENCIMCNQCSFVCPHAVIRPFLLDEDEYRKAPQYIQDRCLKPILPAIKDYYYILSFSIMDCTGCGLCVNTCPGKKGEKALVYDDLNERLKDNEQEIFNYLSEHVTAKEVNNNTLIGTQFNESKFCYSGACAGCGETAYIKLLTQMFGDNMIIANATGCTSIYSASSPSMAYNVPWASSLFEDNAEYGYGMLMANKVIRHRLKKIMEDNMDNPNQSLFQKWLDNMDDYKITKEVYDNLDYNTVPKEITELKDYLISRIVWTIGGDGWAYDIGFGGIDHVLASNDDVNILVLDSQVYSNTGGQSSKATHKGAIAAFASIGKDHNKKDLARIVMSYPHVYVAQVSLGANPAQLIKAFNEAAKHKGPSIVIAYTPCIAHGIKGGLINSVESEKLATKCGYFPIFRYNPDTETFSLDSKDVDFDLYEDFLLSQSRYSLLKVLNPDNVSELIQANKESSIKRFEYYKSLVKDEN
ncbi:MAG: pyruvate:ferredoxin (flavodoxin) oxidoreductase [Bacilli bacterium]|nr:pyruvate:ferredoxin (flavodoxin) oxidoreductase [Bacilli bacterium]MDD4809118.1 pyruvate:ferredoxin (flavodoxin) oxidoreductase [Bacilli bacterium]